MTGKGIGTAAVRPHPPGTSSHAGPTTVGAHAEYGKSGAPNAAGAGGCVPATLGSRRVRANATGGDAMGGMFSGRWGWGYRKKTRVDQCRAFAIAHLLGDTPPAAGYAGRLDWRGADGTVVASIRFAFVTASRVRLDYVWGDDAKPITLPFDLTDLPTPNGGTRYLAACPLVVAGVPCRRRVAKLYLPPGSPYFGCRHCHQLTYRSRQAHDKRVTRLLRSGTLPELAAHPEGQSVQTLGLILMALTEEDRRFDRALKKFGPKPKPRRRKPR